MRLPDLSHRWQGQELMDDPHCSEALLINTFRQFAAINRLVSRYRAILSRWVLRDMLGNPQRDYHLVDVGAGGCDIPVWLLNAAAKRNLRLHVTALDSDPRAIRYARGRYGRVAGLDIREGESLPPNSADYVFCNHVLHHIPEAGLPGFLHAMRAAARRVWIVSDVQRSRWSYAGYALLSLLFRRSFAREDGLRSIRRGFTREELRTLLDASESTRSARVHSLPPGRLVIVGSGAEPSAQWPAG